MNKQNLSEDLLHLENDKLIKPLMKDETIFFSDKITKINRFGSFQERSILLTNKSIYNLKGKIIKRRIDIRSLKAITISNLTDEFVVHGSKYEYDYHYLSSRRKKIIELVAKFFYLENNKEILLFEVGMKNLSHVVTTKNEKKKNPEYSKMPSQSDKISLEDFLSGFTPEPIRYFDFIPIGVKVKKDVKLSDFKVILTLGEGTFGKVTLVEELESKKLYAMKSIKKHVILENGQIEYIKVEKIILEDLDHPFIVSLICCFQTEDRIYLVMPFLKGGELFKHIKKCKFFDEDKYILFYNFLTSELNSILLK